MSTSLSQEELLTRTQPSDYDNSMVFLHKKAIELGVPVNYILVQASRDTPGSYLDSFDLDENESAVIRTIFDVVRQMLIQDPDITLDQIADILEDVRGDAVRSTEIIFIWLHAIALANEDPDTQLNLSADEIFQQVNTYVKPLRGIEKYPNVDAVYNAYYQWYDNLIEEYNRDVENLIKFTDVERVIQDINPVFHGPLIPDTVTVFYEYPTEPGINPLPDLFNAALNSYIVPFIQFNIKPLFKGEGEVSERQFKIYKGESVDSRPKYNNVLSNPNQNRRGQTIYLNVWAGENILDDEGNISEVGNQREARNDKAFNSCSITYVESTQKLIITVTSPRTEGVDEMVMIERIHQHIPLTSFPMPSVDDVKIQRISGSFRLYNVAFGVNVLSSLIMMDPIFSTYLALDEKSKSFPDRSKFKIIYRSATIKTSDVVTKSKSRPEGKRKTKSKGQSVILATLKSDYISPNEVFTIENPDKTQEYRQQPESLPIVEVKISDAASVKVVQQFMEILARLFIRYNERAEEIEAQYLEFVPNYQVVVEQAQQERDTTLSRLISAELPSSIEEISGTQKERELRRYAPEVFVSGYPRRCPPIRQPRLIRPEDAAFWQDRMVRVGTEIKQREILEFPKDDPRYLLVCPNDEYPLPGLLHNTILPNRNIYPYIPCCFADEQKREKNLEIYYGGAVKTAGKKGSHTISRAKILEAGRSGTIPPVITNYLKMYRPNAGEFKRYGFSRSPNSLFHCIFHALNVADYMSIPESDEDAREELVADFRASLFDTGVYPDLARQELFDRSTDEIIEMATDNDEFFDPLNFYRLLEELFKCNIYVFAYTDQVHEGTDKMSLLQLPRHKYFHVHPPTPGRPVVLIIRHWGAKAVAEQYPQCELIYEKRGNELTYLFDDVRMYELMCQAINFVGRTLTWQILESQVETSEGYLSVPEMTTRVNMYSMINYSQLFGEIPIIGQYIDSAGKARMLAIVPQWGNREHTDYDPLQIYITVPPTAPLNVPSFQPEDIADNLPPYHRLIELLGQPISATTSTDGGYLTGLWFPVGDIQFGFYCPCQDFPFSDFIADYPGINQNSELAALTVHIPRQDRTEEVSSLDRLRVLERMARFIDQIVKYLYLNSARDQSIDDFLDSIGIISDSGRIPDFRSPNGSGEDEEPVDSVEIYNPRTISRILPISEYPPGPEAVQDILNQLSEMSPRVFPNGRFLFYDNKMYNGIKYQLYNYIRKIVGLEIQAESMRELKNYYNQKEDYDFDPNTQFILGSLQEYNVWVQIYSPSSNLQQRINQNLRENIQTTLSADAFTLQEPYVYQQSSTNIISSNSDPSKDRFYLIQNVIGSEYERALQVALNWYNEKKNTGFGTTTYSGELAPLHKIYRISSSGHIMLGQDLSDGQDNFLELLNYGENLYAAMLPIL